MLVSRPTISLLHVCIIHGIVLKALANVLTSNCIFNYNNCQFWLIMLLMKSYIIFNWIALTIAHQHSTGLVVKQTTHDQKVLGSIPVRVENILLYYSCMLDECSKITSLAARSRGLLYAMLRSSSDMSDLK